MPEDSAVQTILGRVAADEDRTRQICVDVADAHRRGRKDVYKRQLLNRTKPGRYMYAIGGNREAARRAGVNTKWIRTLGFTLCSLNGGIAGLIIAGQFQGVSTSVDGGQLVLYSIAAAVIGGASLFGGRGKAIHGVIGGLVIAGIVNGMALLETSAQLQYVKMCIRDSGYPHGPTP